ncbi:MAG: hypothetical protein M0Z66_14665 [Thermaerobacter sp.]|nr:hypothetical protein [Thermaerobacter sp.]
MMKNISGLSRIAAATATLGLIGFLAAGCGQQTAVGNASAAPPTPAPTKVSLDWQVVNGGNAQHPDWPFFSADGTNPFPATVNLPANADVTLTIKNADDGADAVPAAYGKVTGTVGNVETVAGKTISSLNATNQVSHTFTISGLGLNIPLPASSTVTVTFHTPSKSGDYTWQCFVPCGTGSDGWGGPMVTAGWMTGTVHIQ